MGKEEWENNEEIKIFREYLRIPTVHPDIDYTACVEFLKKQATDLGLPVDVLYPANEKNPVVVIKWEGKHPDLQSIILNSHTDVVPVYPEKWTHDPFGAEIDDEGRIFARGSQDTKEIGTQYLGAIRALKASGFQPKRTVYVTFVPDEEVGGHLGMREFVKTDYFKNMNVGYSLDEGGPSFSEEYNVFYAERTAWPVKFKITGTAGHGSLLLPKTAGEKLNYIVNKMTEYRTSQVKRMADEGLFFGDVTTVNLTQLNGGVQNNVVPAELEVVFDIRIAIDVDLVAFEKQLRDWCKEAGEGVELIFERQEKFVPPTEIGESSPLWSTLEKTMNELNLKIKPQVHPGVSDSRYLRPAGVAALGFSPMNNNTPLRIHDNDEFVQADVYLHGIEIYKKIIAAITNISVCQRWNH